MNSKIRSVFMGFMVKDNDHMNTKIRSVFMGFMKRVIDEVWGVGLRGRGCGVDRGVVV